jgi:hypothetical protein
MAASKIARTKGVLPYKEGKDPDYKFLVQAHKLIDYYNAVLSRLALAKAHGVNVSFTADCEGEETALAWVVMMKKFGGVTVRAGQTVVTNLKDTELATLKGLPTPRTSPVISTTTGVDGIDPGVQGVRLD